MVFEKTAIDWINTRASVATRVNYKRDLKLWLNFCKKNKVNPEKPPIDVVTRFRDEDAKRRAPLSVRRTLSALSSLYSSVSKSNPFSEKALPRPPASRFHKTPAVPDDIVRKMIDVASQRGESPLRDVALLYVLWTTGMRRISVVSIRRDGIKQIDGVWTIEHVVKGGTLEESELTQDAYNAIMAWLDVAPKSKWLFCTVDGKEALKEASVSKVVNSAAKELKVKVSPHMFRSAAATTLLNAGVPLEQVRAFLHHRDVRSTLGYDRARRGAGVAAKLADFRSKT